MSRSARERPASSARKTARRRRRARAPAPFREEPPREPKDPPPPPRGAAGARHARKRASTGYALSDIRSTGQSAKLASARRVLSRGRTSARKRPSSTERGEPCAKRPVVAQKAPERRQLREPGSARARPWAGRSAGTSRARSRDRGTTRRRAGGRRRRDREKSPTHRPTPPRGSVGERRRAEGRGRTLPRRRSARSARERRGRLPHAPRETAGAPRGAAARTRIPAPAPRSTSARAAAPRRRRASVVSSTRTTARNVPRTKNPK